MLKVIDIVAVSVRAVDGTVWVLHLLWVGVDDEEERRRRVKSCASCLVAGEARERGGDVVTQVVVSLQVCVVRSLSCGIADEGEEGSSLEDGVRGMSDLAASRCFF